MERVAGSWRSHRGRWIAAGIVAIFVAVAAVYWFGPQHLLIDRRANEALPTVDALASPVGTGAPGDDDGGGSAGNAEAAAPNALASGSFQSLAHETTGEASLVELEDGRRFLRIEALDTLSGPDLRVYLTSASAGGDDGALDEGLVVDLGGLRANTGNLTYPIPKSVDLDEVRSVTIWCRRFSVGFGVAPLVPAD